MDTGTLLLLLAGAAFTALYLSPDYLQRLLKLLKWSMPNIENEQRPVQVLLFVLAFACFTAAIGFAATALAAFAYFAWRFLKPSRG